MALEGTAGTVDQVGSQFKGAAADLGRAAAEQVDSRRGAAADGIESAAQNLHAGGQRAAGLAHGTADKLSKTADYIREHDLNAMVADVKALAKNNPVPAMLTAAALGFLLAKAFSSRD